MAKKTELVAVEAKDLKVIEYRGLRIVTTEQMAAGYGTDAENIRRNFNRNKSRFVEGKHYFQISGNELDRTRRCKPREDAGNRSGLGIPRGLG